LVLPASLSSRLKRRLHRSRSSSVGVAGPTSILVNNAASLVVLRIVVGVGGPRSWALVPCVGYGVLRIVAGVGGLSLVARSSSPSSPSLVYHTHYNRTPGSSVQCRRFRLSGACAIVMLSADVNLVRLFHRRYVSNEFIYLLHLVIYHFDNMIQVESSIPAPYRLPVCIQQKSSWRLCR